MIVIRIETGNAAFEAGAERPEVARILRHVADNVEAGRLLTILRDINGNRVGTIERRADEN